MSFNITVVSNDDPDIPAHRNWVRDENNDYLCREDAYAELVALILEFADDAGLDISFESMQSIH